MGGQDARPLALTGKMPVPQEDVFAQLGCSPTKRDRIFPCHLLFDTLGNCFDNTDDYHKNS